MGLRRPRAYPERTEGAHHVGDRPGEVHLYESADHKGNFLQCVRTRGETIAPIENAHRSVSCAHLGNLAMLLGRKLKWDPEKERFINDPEADRMLSRSMRAPWSL